MNVRQSYTGYLKDEESGLEFAEARYYNPQHGRFTSVDPLTASATVRNPQTFNRFSYVENSPISYKDPFGLFRMEGSAPVLRSSKEVCWEFGVCGRSELYISFKETDETGRKYPFPESIRDFGVNDGLNKSCVQRERQRCHQLGEEYFNNNVLKFMAVDALWFTGSMNTVYGMITGASLWSVKRIAGPAGVIAGALWGVRRAALEGERIEKECDEKIPEKCRNGCSS